MSRDLVPGESAFHRLIKSFLPKREQGQTMGAYRRLWETEFANFQTVALYNELELYRRALADTKHVFAHNVGMPLEALDYFEQLLEHPNPRGAE